ncbi:MAG: hypothetical protein U0269_03925 [Polyangiales bacterium]
MKHRTIALIALWALGSSACAGGSSYSEPSTRASATSEQATSGGAASATSAPASDDSSTSYDSATRAQPPQRNTAPANATAGGATTTAPAGEPVQMLSRDDQIAQWQTRLAAGEQQFLASAGVCRDVCRATDSICHASRELCALTGDREGAPPTDPRCARARASCERAARQRQESCNICPAE